MQTSAKSPKFRARIRAAWVRRNAPLKSAEYALRLATDAATRTEPGHPDHQRAHRLADRARAAARAIRKPAARFARVAATTAGLALAMTPAHAADDWTDSQLAKAAALATLTAADWSQTRNIARHPSRWHETNPLLGEHPTTATVDRHFIASAVLGAALLHALPSNVRDYALDAGLVLEVGCVANNVRLGIGIKF
ncbi:hypothetical protein GCM10007933_02590 [Zoogloea oryzae]|uniref:Uncharacterized protein n=1 Tax=Zoogloea oryzae TaxID=310767 RepID=A0ABQ6F6C5_9RHOO|nr:hypothetical protein [Zoogloea oryzae]GLT20807.1 hypothetical protein GCM10007933_02590 [Zoogloea oryzae]